jgi:hypothetical protein
MQHRAEADLDRRPSVLQPAAWKRPETSERQHFLELVKPLELPPDATDEAGPKS